MFRDFVNSGGRKGGTLRLEGAQKPETAVAWRFAAQQSGQFYWHDNMDL